MNYVDIKPGDIVYLNLSNLRDDDPWIRGYGLVLEQSGADNAHILHEFRGEIGPHRCYVQRVVGNLEGIEVMTEGDSEKIKRRNAFRSLAEVVFNLRSQKA